MAKRTGTTNIQMQALIKELKHLANKNEVPLWKRIAEELEKPARQRREANLDKIEKETRENEVALVPGKVLSNGDITKNITVAAFNFSAKAKEKINKMGKAISIKELIKSDPKGKRIRIIG